MKMLRSGLLITWVFCFCRTSFASDAGLSYHFTVTDRPDLNRFILTVKSTDPRPMCLYTDKWPNRLGQLHFGSTWVSLTARGVTLRAHDSNFGVCRGDASCYIYLPPGGTLTAFIGYEQFGDPAEIAALAERELKFPIALFRCPKKVHRAKG